MSKKLFSVTVLKSVYSLIDVEAENAAEAEDLIQQMILSDSKDFHKLFEGCVFPEDSTEFTTVKCEIAEGHNDD